MCDVLSKMISREQLRKRISEIEALNSALQDEVESRDDAIKELLEKMTNGTQRKRGSKGGGNTKADKKASSKKRLIKMTGSPK